MAALSERQVELLKRHLGADWHDLRDDGSFGELVAAWGASCNGLAKAFGWKRTGALRHAIETHRPQAAALDADPAVLRGLAGDLHTYLQRTPSVSHDVQALADQFDRSPKSIRAAVEQLRAAQYDVHVTDDEQLTLRRSPAPTSAAYTNPGFGETSLLFGVISDTHFGSKFAAYDELEAAYDMFASEGVLAVIHCGDLMDGPGDSGYQGHSLEVRDDCQTAHQQIEFTKQYYPKRPGVRTVFIESGKSHAGWQYARNGLRMGAAVADGNLVPGYGPDGDEDRFSPGREDMEYLGLDERTFAVGPEKNTLLSLNHPDGGTAYALSYNLQKWAEGVEGGDKPNAAFFGHYHKYCVLYPRNMATASIPGMQWQTPFMKRKKIAAHVGACLCDLQVDADGTIRKFNLPIFPFFRYKRTVYIMPEVA